MKVEVDDIEYEWLGWFGTVLTSVELEPLREDHLRVIKDRLMYVRRCEVVGWTWGCSLLPRRVYEISWGAHGVKVTTDWLDQFKIDLFHIGYFIKKYVYQDEQFVKADSIKPRHPAPPVTLYPLEEWHDDDGLVLWWKLPVEEPPYVGTPLDSGWEEGYYTHWSKLEVIYGTE